MVHTEHEEVKADEKKIELRVAGASLPSAVAGALMGFIREGKEVTLTAMGAGPVNQLVKACAVAQSHAAPMGKQLWFQPFFRDEYPQGVHRTALVFKVMVKE